LVLVAMEEVSEDWTEKISALPSEVLTTSATCHGMAAAARPWLAACLPRWAF
jgi:hypothetical protein